MSDNVISKVETDSDGTRAEKKVVEVDGEAPVGDRATSPSGPAQDKGGESKGDVEEIRRLLNQGKRQYLVRDYQASTDTLSESCAGFAKHHGDMAIECAEPLLLYAQSLLELARIESRVIDNGLEGVPIGDDYDNSQVEDPEKCTDEERKEVKKAVGEALEANFSELEELASKKAESESKKETEESEATKDEENPEEESEPDDDPEAEGDEAEVAEGEEKVDPCEEATEDGKGDVAADPADVQADAADDDGNMTNIQLAWENADLAKAIYQKHLATLSEGSSEKNEMEVKLCEALALLGEIAIEDGNFSSAIDDLRICLELRVKKLADDSRAVSGSYFQLGEALSHDSKYAESLESFEKAVDVLTRRVANLKLGKVTHDIGWTQDESYSTEKEISEIEVLIPEIQGRIKETKELQEEEKENPVEMEEDQLTTDKENVEPVSKGSASDANHLVKKRKKSDEGDESEINSKMEDPPKKLHLEKGDVAAE